MEQRIVIIQQVALKTKKKKFEKLYIRYFITILYEQK